MKRTVLVTIVALLIATLAMGCGQKKDPAPATPPMDYEDGTYSAIEEKFDDHGWKSMTTVVVEGGRIVKSFFDEINEDGLLKSFDPEYNPNMRDVSGTFPMEAYQILEKDLIAKQGVEGVDAVSGATSSSEGFKELAGKALASDPISKKGTYTDGLYKAIEKDFDDRGWRSAVAVIVEDGKIVSALFDEYNKDALYKNVDEDYAENMQGQSGTTPAKAAEALTKSLLEKQDPNGVDAVSGATGTFESFKSLANEALANAK